MPAPEPVITVDLVAPERAALVELLESLSDAEWQRPTVCAGWSVKDLVLHVLGDDLGLLSRGRDGFAYGGPEDASWESLVAFLNEWNERWVEGTRRLSSRVLLELLRGVAPEVEAYFASLDLHAIGGPVSWAGPEPAPVWLDVAREYTERWLHQQQIRDAVARPGLDDRRFIGPVIETFVRALPRAYREVGAPPGTKVAVVVTGDGGGVWSVERGWTGWTLASGTAPGATATVRLDRETAWRRSTRGIDRDTAASRAQIDGDRDLGAVALDAVAMIA